jgi:hypothetical protein
MGSGGGVNRSKLEAVHLPTCGAEVKNAWSYTSTPPTSIHGLALNSLFTHEELHNLF